MVFLALAGTTNAPFIKTECPSHSHHKSVEAVKAPQANNIDPFEKYAMKLPYVKLNA